MLCYTKQFRGWGAIRTKYNRRIPNKWLPDLQLDFVIGDPVHRHASCDEKLYGESRERMNARERETLS